MPKPKTGIAPILSPSSQTNQSSPITWSTRPPRSTESRQPPHTLNNIDSKNKVETVEEADHPHYPRRVSSHQKEHSEKTGFHLAQRLCDDIYAFKCPHRRWLGECNCNCVCGGIEGSADAIPPGHVKTTTSRSSMWQQQRQQHSNQRRHVAGKDDVGGHSQNVSPVPTEPPWLSIPHDHPCLSKSNS